MLVLGMLLWAACGGRNDGPRKEGRMAETDPMAEFRTDVLRVVGGYREVDYVPVADFAEIPGHVYFKSINWARDVFREGMGPFDTKEATHAYHLAGPDSLDFDLVRHTYRAAGCTVDVKEGAGFYKIRFSAYDPRSFGGTDPLKQAARLAETFFAMESPVFRYLGADTGSAQVMSSAPEKTLAQMEGWADRLDAVRTTSGIIMIVYKRHFELEEAIDFNQWFPEDWRSEKSGAASPDTADTDADEE